MTRSAHDSIVEGEMLLRDRTSEPPQALTIEPDKDRLRCAAKGVSISWDPTCASHAANDHALCVVWGFPRDDAGSALGSPLAASALFARLLSGGTAALAALRGSFAFCFLDVANGHAILAVDRLSTETICWAREGERLCFADRADRVPMKARRICEQAIYDYLHFHCIPAPRTAFAEIHRLCNGSLVEARGRDVGERPYWIPRFDESNPAPLRDLYPRFRQLVSDAVRIEAQRPEALGCFLSGGTDSSTIAGMLCGVSEQPARTYSIGFDAAGYDEMSYARIAAAHFGTRHREYYVTADDIAASVPMLAAFLDQPFGNSSLVAAHFCVALAGSDGVQRLLAGDGGDELFGGNSRYAFQQLLGNYDRVPSVLRTGLIEPLFSGPLNRVNVPGIRQARAYVRRASPPMPDRMEADNLLLRIGAAQILEREWLEHVDQALPLASQREVYRSSSAYDPINRILCYDWKFTLADSDLPKVRNAVALNGLSVGYPFLADEIVEFSTRLLPRWKVRRGQLRWFFKQALRDFLPEAILRKRKHGFGLPFGVWANEHASLRELAADSLEGLERRHILRRGFRDRLMSVLLPEHPGYYGELVWILMMLERWMSAHSETPNAVSRDDAFTGYPA